MDLLVPPCCLEDTQDVDKQVNKVQVEVDGGNDVLLRRELVHDDVGVKDDKTTEQHSPSNGQHKLQCLAPEEQLQDK